MADGKLYVIITTNPDGVGGGGGGGGSQATNTKANKVNPLAEYARHELYQLVKQTVTQSVNFGIQQIGNLTGEYAVQRDVQLAMNVVEKGISIGKAAIGGASIGSAFGPVGAAAGAAIGAGIAVVESVTTSVFNIHNNSISNRKTNYEISQLRARAGLDSTTNDSRGTEN